MRFRKMLIPLFIALVFCFIFTVGAEDKEVKVTYGLDVLARETSLVKSCLENNDVHFCAEDFERALNVSRITYITVTSLPARSDGVLCLGNGEVSEGQVISRANIPNLVFMFSEGSITQSCFGFQTNFGVYDLSCEMKVVTNTNGAPVSGQTQTVNTYRNVSIMGKMYAEDPENDALRFEIVSYPTQGILVEKDASLGTFVYYPKADVTGSDSFRYVAVDDFGNYSAASTVMINVEAPYNSLVYSDMVDRKAHVAAIALTDRGIMTGTTVEGTSFFYPTQKMTRLEFVVACVKALSNGEIPQCDKTVFADDDSIPVSAKGYIDYAQKKGLICGKIGINGDLYFEPFSTITVAESAVIASNVVSIETKDYMTAVIRSPLWASEAVEAMASVGAWTDDLSDASGELTREQGAYLIYVLSEN